MTMEFPHLLRLMEGNQFDTIYHEHFCYFSLITVQKVLAAHGLTVFDVEELPTHGGSLRIYARHADECGVAGRPGRRTSCCSASWTPVSTRIEGYRTFAARCKRPSGSCWSF